MLNDHPCRRLYVPDTYRSNAHRRVKIFRTNAHELSTCTIFPQLDVEEPTCTFSRSGKFETVLSRLTAAYSQTGIKYAIGSSIRPIE